MSECSLLFQDVPLARTRGSSLGSSPDAQRAPPGQHERVPAAAAAFRAGPFLLAQGHLYLGVRVCFGVKYVLLFFLLVKLVIPWVDIQKLEKTSNAFLTATIRVSTPSKERDFSMFLDLEGALQVMEQLADVTLRRLLDNEGFDLDPPLQEPSQITKR